MKSEGDKSAPKDMYKERYVLAEGYPWADGLGPYYNIAMCQAPTGVVKVAVIWPEELWLNAGLPRYRLVLERVEEP